MACPKCNGKERWYSWFGYIIDSYYICRNCGYELQIKSLRANLYSISTEILLPLGAIVMVIYKIPFFFLVIYFLTLFSIWFFIIRSKMFEQLKIEKEKLSL